MARVPGTYDWRDDRYYRGTKTSAQLLTGYEMGYGKILRGICWVTVVCPVYIVVTLPADALIDTVLLPYDAVQPERPKMQPYDYDPAPVAPLTPEEIYELQHPSEH
ncbi:YceK/YidQ family lipoprotein [Pseudomonas sp. TH05]|nr:YceK/YidQ family lipoprotein [Pseudomonas sp. TH05]MBK5542232.1 YceK/YidQ family lipoprotein [Pseudomonas sp. TH07]MBK5559596.1 YceK/YidQ family lipoprotein [Pseudomonas sp. TH05]